MVEPQQAAQNRIEETRRNGSTWLDLSGLVLTHLPRTISGLTSLTGLDLSFNHLTELPGSIGRLTSLTTLDLANNHLTELPESIGQLANLTTLDLANNHLTKLPESIGRLTKLTLLRVQDNRLTELPESIGRLTSLTKLDVFKSRLTELPESIGQLTKLTELDLSGNLLTELPESIGQLTDLIDLDAANNRLTRLPESIGRLTHLTYLNFANNQLTELPESIGELTILVQLGIDRNPLVYPPMAVAVRGAAAVLAFLRAGTKASTRMWRSKVLIVGEATVGKTSLAKQLNNEAFDPGEPQTHGLLLRPLRLAHPDRPDAEMALTMWDFGGQLEYRATQRFYLTDRSLFLLVWNSRARWHDGKVLGWLDVITARAPRAPILLVATHGDEPSAATLPEDLQRRYPRIVGIHTVDSRSGSGIDVLREAVRRQAADLPLMGARWPTAWENAARSIRELPGHTATTRQAWITMAAAGVTEPDAQQTIARAMHDLGDIVYFADNRELAQKMILKPEWLDTRITQAIDSSAVADARGVLTRAERQNLWGDLADAEDDPELLDRLLLMMEQFDLAYRVGDAERSTDVALVVERLGESRPAQVDHEWQRLAAQPKMREIGIIYKLASRQAGIPTWFLAREHRYTTGLHWRNGALLHDRDQETPAWALIVDDEREQPTVTLRVIGSYPVRFLSVLTEAFNNIIEDRYPNLVENKLVPCACEAASGGRCRHAFTLKALITEATADEPDADHKVRCEESGRRIEAAIMLDGLRGTGLIAELEAIRKEVAAQADTLTRIDRDQLATVNGIRTLLEHRALAGIHCPSLFSVQPTGRTKMLHRESVTLRLWCEWPAGPHPVDDERGNYTIKKMPPGLARYLPYLQSLITALGLITPGLTTLGVALDERVSAGIESAAKTLEFIKSHAAEDALALGRDTPLLASRPGQAATGADFRALRHALRELDPDEHWGELAPVSRPEDRRIIYLCPRHLHDLDYPYVGMASSGPTSPNARSTDMV